MPSKLAVATQRTDYPAWLKEHVRLAGMRVANLLNPDQGEAAPFGDLIYLGRLYFEGEADKPLQYEGARGADKYLELVRGRVERCPWITYWRGLNEPDTSSLLAVEQFVAFEQRRIEGMHRWGKKVVTFDFGTGRPEVGFPQEVARRLVPVAMAADGRAYHEYGMRRMELDGVHLLRHRELEKWLLTYGANSAPVFITETGIDYHGDPQRDGWKAQLKGDRQEYLRQLSAYDRALLEEPWVVAATPFIWLHSGWPSFDIDQETSRLIAEYVRAQGGGVGVPSGASSPLPTTPPAADDSWAAELAEALQDAVIPQNRRAWFYQYGRARGWEPISAEQTRTVRGVRALGQVWYTPSDDVQHVVYAKVDAEGRPLDDAGRLTTWQAATRHYDRRN